MPTTATVTKSRGIAAMGKLFRAVSGDKVKGRDLLTRVCLGDKRVYFNLGADEEEAHRLNQAVRAAIRNGRTVDEVKVILADLRQARQRPDGPEPGKTSQLPYRSENHQGAPVIPRDLSSQPEPRNDGAAMTPAALAVGWISNSRTLFNGKGQGPGQMGSVACVTVRDLVLALAQHVTTRSCHKDVQHRYIMSLLNAIELVTYARAGCLKRKPDRRGRRVSYEDFDHFRDGKRVPAMDCEISNLDEHFADDFFDARIERGAADGTRHASSVKISAGTEFRQLRSLFSTKWAQAAYDRAQLRLPNNIADLVTYQRNFFDGTKVPFSPSPDQIRKVHDLIRQHARMDDRNFVMVAVLALFCGLRRSEILHARKDWLRLTAYGPTLVVVREDDFRPKFGRERSIVIPRWLYNWLLASADQKYLVADEAMARSRAAERVTATLRELGFDCQKPLHCQRAVYAAFLRATCKNVYDITERMGHRSFRTTVTYYASAPLAKELVHLWRKPIPTFGPRLVQTVFLLAA